MNKKTQGFKFLVVLAAFLAITLSPITSLASHSWSTYHWARTANPFTLKVVDSNTSDWDASLRTAMNDWSRSSVLDVILDTASDDSARTRKRCPMVSGKIRSCNAAYGLNGWLGLASINLTGGHISQGTSKMNDSYLASGYTETNRQHVMCQEIGHDFGLAHQSESGADLNTCMDYANALDNPSPNAHDYTQLETMYAHLDSTTTVGLTASFGSSVSDNPNSWGQLMSQSANGRSSVYEKVEFDGSRTLTHVFWTQEFAERCRGCDHRYDH